MLASACGTGNKQETALQESQQNTGPSSIEAFWEAWQNALISADKSAALNLMHYPLEGAGNLYAGGDESLNASRQEAENFYSEIVDETVINAVKSASFSNFIGRLESEEDSYYYFDVLYLYEAAEGEPPSDSMRRYIIRKVGGVFLITNIEVAG
jgi:hypothetical protein